jgi:hypothetical protein
LGAGSCRLDGGDDEDGGGEPGGDSADAEKDPRRDGPRRRRAVEPLLVLPPAPAPPEAKAVAAPPFAAARGLASVRRIAGGACLESSRRVEVAPEDEEDTHRIDSSHEDGGFGAPDLDPNFGTERPRA